MPTVNVRNSIQVDGNYYNDYRSITADARLPNGDPIPAGKAGTAGAAGVMTMGTSHGVTTADTVMVTWALGRRYGCSVSAYDGTTVTVDGATGAGDALPTSGAIVLAKKLTLDVAFAGSQISALHLGSDKAALATIEDGSTIHLAVDIEANGAFQWSGNGVANPITGDTVTKANFYSKTAEAGVATFFASYNNA